MAVSSIAGPTFARRATARLARNLFLSLSTTASSLRRRFKVVNLAVYGLVVGVTTSSSHGSCALFFVTHLLRMKYSRLPGGPRGLRFLSRSVLCLTFFYRMPRKQLSMPHHTT